MVSLKPFLEQTFHSKGVFHSRGQRLCLISSSPLHVTSCQGPYPRRQMGFISFRHRLLISPTPSLFTPLPQRLHSIKPIPKYHYLLSVRSFKSKGHKTKYASMKERKTLTEKVLISSKNGVKLEKPGSESRKDPKEMSQPENTAEKKPSLEHNRLDGQRHHLCSRLCGCCRRLCL